MSLPFIADGSDFSALTNDRTYTVTYQRQPGPNGSAVMLDGSELLDTITVKAVITWNLNFLTGETLSNLLKVMVRNYVTVAYWDPLSNSARTSEFIPEIGPFPYAFRRNGIDYYRDGVILTLRERRGREVEAA